MIHEDIEKHIGTNEIQHTYNVMKPSLLDINIGLKKYKVGVY